MKFESTYLKLTFFYVLIVMAISLIFSISIFRISSREVRQGLGRQAKVLRDLPAESFMNHQLPDLEQIRLDQIEQIQGQLKLNLLYFNLLILVISTILSYFLAQRTLKPIEEAMEDQNRFTADASHELRTPLTAMRSEIEVALRDKQISLADAKALLTSNLEEIEKLETLSSSLLKLARHQEGVKEAELKLISLEDALAEAYQKVEPLATNKEITFENSLKNHQIMGDHQSLTELFVILLENAIKYSPKKSTIKIVMNQEKHFGTVEIIDQGIGIKSSDLPYIFNRFFRSDLSRNKEKVDGYGLGLSIAKRIVEAHGGELEAESKIGKGTTFIFRYKLNS